MWLATALASTTPGQVSLSLEEFGVGGTYRPGDWTGIRVTVRNDGPERRDHSPQIEQHHRRNTQHCRSETHSLEGGQRRQAWALGETMWRIVALKCEESEQKTKCQ